MSGMIYGDDIFYLWKIHSMVITNKARKKLEIKGKQFSNELFGDAFLRIFTIFFKQDHCLYNQLAQVFVLVFSLGRCVNLQIYIYKLMQIYCCINKFLPNKAG